MRIAKGRRTKLNKKISKEDNTNDLKKIFDIFLLEEFLQLI